MSDTDKKNISDDKIHEFIISDTSEAFLKIASRVGLDKAYALQHKAFEVSSKFDDLPSCSVCSTPWGPPPFRNKPDAASTCSYCTSKLWNEHVKSGKLDQPFLDPLRRTPYFMCVCGLPIYTGNGDFYHSLSGHAMSQVTSPTGKIIKDRCKVDLAAWAEFKKTYGWQKKTCK